MKNIKWSAILTSLLYIAAGVYLYLFPNTTAQMICDAIGIALIAVGAVKIILYFLLDVRTILFRNDFVEGLVMLLGGGFLLYNQKDLLTMVPFVLSGVILVSGFVKLQDGIDQGRIGYGDAGWNFIFALIAIAVGVVTLLNVVTDEAILKKVFAFGLIYCGATDLFSSIFLSAKIRKFYKTKHEEEQAEEKKKSEEENEALKTRLKEEIRQELEEEYKNKLEEEKQKLIATPVDDLPVAEAVEPEETKPIEEPVKEGGKKLVKSFMNLLKTDDAATEEVKQEAGVEEKPTNEETKMPM